jgi:DNA repair protein RadC
MFKLNDETGLYEITGPIGAHDILAEAKRIIFKQFYRGNAIDNPEATKNYLRLELSLDESEHFCAIWLDNRHHVLAFERMFNGTINACSVHPREVVKRALSHNASAVIFAHNHPSGIPEPSSADIQLTEQLKKACELIDCRVLDHIVIGGGESVSFADRGII